MRVDLSIGRRELAMRRNPYKSERYISDLYHLVNIKRETIEITYQ
jgi:hypothetical protein